MKENIIITYSFDELPKETQEKVLDKYRDINTDCKFCDGFIEEECENIGIEIQEYDLSKGTIKINCKESIEQIANNIVGSIPDLEIAAKTFLHDYNKIEKEIEKNDKEDPTETEYRTYKTLIWDRDESQNSFESKIKNFIFDQLKEEYNYQTSNEAVLETIRANEYQFTENGDMFTL